MRLSMLSIVNQTALTRDRIDGQVEAIKRGKLVVSIDGERADEAIIALVRPVIERQLLARKATLEHDLEIYGVRLD